MILSKTIIILRDKAGKKERKVKKKNHIVTYGVFLIESIGMDTDDSNEFFTN